jgi:signal transduction histidine kinase/CheY-like chemotaxis protein/HPt (histidine-containing phosphotransfer) domain-containing protein
MPKTIGWPSAPEIRLSQLPPQALLDIARLLLVLLCCATTGLVWLFAEYRRAVSAPRSSTQVEPFKRDLSKLLDVLPSMIGYFDKNLVNRMANRAFARWFDLDPTWVPGTRLRNLSADILLTPDLPAVEAALRGETVIFERTLPGSRGAGMGHVQLQYVPDVVAGEVLGFYMLGHDITAHKEAQRRLIDSEKFLESAETVSRVGGFMIELATGEVRWTRQTYRIHEVEPSYVPTSFRMHEFLSPAVQALLQERMLIARETGVGYDLEVQLLTGRKRMIWVRVVGEIEHEEGVPVRIVGAMQDITDRRNLEQLLRDATAVADKANRSKSQFLANMSHEIRTPLNAVIGLGYLLDQTELSEDQRLLLAKIQFAGHSLLGVVNNVLDLSKIEAGEMSLEDEPFDLTELVSDVTQMLEPQAAAKGIELLVKPAPALPRVLRGDATRMRQILTNLLHNAIKFTEVGRVSLALSCARQDAGRLRLRCEVEDTGIGVDAAGCERLFAPFAQADTSTTRRFGGTGLGLSIAHRFVELMGGEIGVTSVPGRGSTFWLEIPMGIVLDSDAAMAPLGLGILVMDSAGDTPHGVGAMVRALGWSPQVVDKPGQVFAATAAARPDRPLDVIILDLHDQDLDAHRLIEQLAGHVGAGPGPSVIVVASSADSYLHHEAHMRGSDVLLLRAVTGSTLFNAINTSVSRQPDTRERVFKATRLDNLHAQWLVGVRVLVVDDSDINREVAQRILVKQGAIVSTCTNGEAALEQVRDQHADLDLVLMDVQMPILDGNEAARRIRCELGLTALPIVALTAGALVGERQRSLESGMNDFISKPFDPQALIRKVRHLVEAARGTPIHVVFEENPRPESAAGRLGLDSIDDAVVRQVFGDDLSLFKSLLVRLLRDYADMMLPRCLATADAVALEQLQARAHKLKGSAGMVGASQVMRFAGEAERLLREGHPTAATEAVLEKLSAALISLREESAPWCAAPERPAWLDDPASLDPLGVAEIEQLTLLFDSQNLAAMDQFTNLSPALERRLGPQQFAELREGVEALDFQHCAQMMRAIA